MTAHQHVTPAVVRLDRPPQNAEAERQLLGGLLVENSNIPAVVGKLRPEHFFVKEHAAIYSTILAKFGEGKPANPVTVRPFTDGERVAGMAPVQYILRLTQDAASATVIADYADVIIELSVRRRLALVGWRYAQGAIDLTADDRSSDLISDIEAELCELRQDLEFAEADTSISGATATLDETIRRVMAGEKSNVPKLGLPDLDYWMTGLHPGRMIVGAGRPGMGKTIFNIAGVRRVARQGYGVGSFTLEIGSPEWTARLIAAESAMSHTPLDYSSILRGELNDVQYRSYQHYAAAVRELPIYLDSTSGLTAAQIEGRAVAMCDRADKAGTPLGLITIDYLGLISPTDRYRGNKVHEVGETMLSLTNMGKRLGCAVLLFCQLSRKVEERSDKMPNMADLRDSGEIEQHADQIAFLYRPAYYDAKDERMGKDDEFTARAEARANDLIIRLDKNRLGPTKDVTLYCDVARCEVSSKDNRR